ncbi:hypothetical protein ACLQ3K_21985 [Tsukamurella sp. DT100]|uniref:hypothetical protein n=1 Tax=Tsukamurella sp. DT100 TaxID=3393415 RepID=UPI003CEBFF8A
MNGPEHYAEAERLLADVDPIGGYNLTSEQIAALLTVAQVHATLALAAATAGQLAMEVHATTGDASEWDAVSGGAS